MDEGDPPVTIQELAQLTNLGVSVNQVTWARVTLTSDRHICIRHAVKADDSVKDQIQVLSLDTQTTTPQIFPYPADSALVSPFDPTASTQLYKLAIRAGDLFLVVRLDSSHAELSSCNIEEVLHWSWLNCSVIGLVTTSHVYHWIVEPGSQPEVVFALHPRVSNSQIVGYRSDPGLRWCALTGLTLQEDTIGGVTQLYSRDKDITQCIEAHCATLTQYYKDVNTNSTTLLCTAARDTSNVSSGKVHLVELGDGLDSTVSPSSGCDVLTFPEDREHYDFPVSIQVSNKHGLLYVFTKYGHMFLVDVETTTCLCSFLVSADVIFASVLNTATEGVLAINRSGQVLSIDLKLAVLVRFLRECLKRPLLAERLERSLPLIPPSDLDRLMENLAV